MTSLNRKRTARALLCALVALSCALTPALAVPALAWDATGLAISADGEALYNPTEAPDTHTTAAILIDQDNGEVLYASNADEKAYPASTTKVMTALVVLEHANLDDVVTVQSSDLELLGEESMMSGLLVDEQISVRNLLACMLIPSGNDAAYVLARYVGGTWQNFITMMNAKAAELGCTGTHFSTPCGLHEDDHYTTARDLARIFEAALQQPTFCEIAGSSEWVLPATNKNVERTLETTDYLIEPSSDAYMEGVDIVGKTGYTDEAGKCLTIAAEKDGRHLVAVTLGGQNDAAYGEPTSNFYGMRDLLEWGFDAWRTCEVVSAGDELGRVGVTLSEDGTSVAAVSTVGVTAFVPAGVGLSDLDVSVDLPASLAAPVEEKTPLGEASVSYQGRYLGSVPVATEKAMSWSAVLFAKSWLRDPLHVAATAAVVVALVVLVALLVRRARGRRDAAAVGSVPAGQPWGEAGARAGFGLEDEDAAQAPAGSSSAASSPTQAKRPGGKHFKG